MSIDPRRPTRRRHRPRRHHAPGRGRRQHLEGRPGRRVGRARAAAGVARPVRPAGALRLPARGADVGGAARSTRRRSSTRPGQYAMVAAREAWADAGSPEVDPRAPRRRGGHRHRRRVDAARRLRRPQGVGPAPRAADDRPDADAERRGRRRRHRVRRPCRRSRPRLGLRVRRRGDGVRARHDPHRPRRRRDRRRHRGGDPPAADRRLRRRCARCRPATTAPETASRPYDTSRDGFVLGEGAGVVVLESARARRAHAARRSTPSWCRPG